MPTKKELEEERRRLLRAIDELVDRIKELEEERERNRFEIQTLHTTIEDLRRQLRDLEGRQ